MDYVVAGVLALLLVEVLVASSWWRPYFTRGLRLYRYSVSSKHAASQTVNLEELATHFRGRRGPSLVFRQLDPGEVAFREAVFELKLFNYTPVMHGLLRVVPGSGEVVVEGRANWFPLAFSLLVVIFVWSRPEAWPVLVFLGVLVAGIGAVQAKAYREIGQVVAHGARLR